MIVKSNKSKNFSFPQRGLVQYLEKLKVCNNIATIKTMIPANIKLENYVTLRLAMRRYAPKSYHLLCRGACILSCNGLDMLIVFFLVLVGLSVCVCVHVAIKATMSHTTQIDD